MLLWWVFLFAGLLVSSNAAKKINLAFLNTEKVLKALKFNKLDTALVQEVSEKMERTVKENQLTATSFLNPLECAVIKEVCAENDVRFAQLGGFGAGTADRNMLLFAPPGSSIGGVQFTPDEVVDQYLAAISVKGSFPKQLTREIVLTSIKVVPGVAADQIGDVNIVSSGEVQALVARAVVGAVCRQLDRVEATPVQVSEIAVRDLAPKLTSQKMITIIEASRRLDAVASGGLGLSRSRIVKMIDKGEVLLNFREASSTATIVQFRDIISLRNGAKLVVDEVTTTSKGKYRINLRRSGSDQRKVQQQSSSDDEDDD